jgi:hypothetical protein
MAMSGIHFVDWMSELEQRPEVRMGSNEAGRADALLFDLSLRRCGRW